MDPTTLMGLMMGTGMVAQAGSQYFSSQIWAGAQESIASTNANMMTTVAQTNANASVDIARQQYGFMTLASQQQYQLELRRIQTMERQDSLQALMWRDQLDTRIKEATLFYNSQILGYNQAHSERMKQIELTHEERLAELSAPTTQEIDPATLLA